MRGDGTLLVVMRVCARAWAGPLHPNMPVPPQTPRAARPLPGRGHGCNVCRGPLSGRATLGRPLSEEFQQPNAKRGVIRWKRSVGSAPQARAG
jgi:hypothetical protein